MSANYHKLETEKNGKPFVVWQCGDCSISFIGEERCYAHWRKVHGPRMVQSLVVGQDGQPIMIPERKSL
jgi:hypothetical protein